MKKSLLFAFLAAGLLVSCSSDDDFDDLETINVSTANYAYDADGVWTQNDKAGFLNIDDYVFSHILDDYSLVYGFTPSKVTVTSHNDTNPTACSCTVFKGFRTICSRYCISFAIYGIR